ncbi:MAG: AzlC family ABC transporter permease [Chloroflexi bacterium]|nr:AzlC family ABC transporter permease [Chloroflexota bacterium]
MDELKTTRLREFMRGAATELPMMLGVVPFGLIFGVAVNAAMMPAIPAQATSSIIFAGASQMIFARLFGEGAPLFTIVLTAAIINLRHVLYSASIAPFLKPFSRKWKFLLAYLLTDEAYAIAISHMETLPPNAPLLRWHKQWYVFGAGFTLWLGWQISTAVGIFIGGQIPPSWSLDFSLPLTFIAIVVPALRDRAGIAAAAAAGICAVAAAAMPLKLGLVTATLLGIAIGMLVEARFGAVKMEKAS